MITKEKFWKLTGTSFRLGCIHVYENTEISCKICPYKNSYNSLCGIWRKETKQIEYKKFMKEKLDKLW